MINHEAQGLKTQMTTDEKNGKQAGKDYGDLESMCPL